MRSVLQQKSGKLCLIRGQGVAGAGGAGFTLIEMLVTLMIVLVLASVALPMAEVARQRDKEKQLHEALHDIREALDAYKQAGDEGRIARNPLESGYPPDLDTLIKGAPDVHSTTGARLFFLRRMPRDPFVDDAAVPPAKTWGLRSYASTFDDPKPGKDVYDIYSTAPGKGMNGIPYGEW